MDVSAGRQNRHSPEGEFMVLLQGGVTLFQGEFSTPTGWLDKPLIVSYRIPLLSSPQVLVRRSVGAGMETGSVTAGSE